VGIPEQLADDQAAAGLQHPRQLTHSGVLIRNLTQHGDEKGGVVGAFLVWHRRSVGLARGDVREAALAGAAHGVVEHFLL
jgi:hypothetical protein